MKREAMDYLIRDTLRQEVREQEPSAGVRDDLLAKAEAHNAHSELVVGSSIPPVANGLRDSHHISSSSVRLPEFEAGLMDFFGATQQRLIAVWMLSGNSRY